MEKPATQPTDATKCAVQRQSKVSLSGPIAGDPLQPFPATLYAARSNGSFGELLEQHGEWPKPSVIGQKTKSVGASRERKGGYRPWSKEADRMLIACVGSKMKVIEKRMKRSIASIRPRLAVVDRGSDSFGGFKTKDLMEMLRLDESTIRRLEGKRLLARQRGRITKDSLKSLCREHPEEIPFETLDEDTKRMLVADYKYGKHRKPKGADGQVKVAEIEELGLEESKSHA
jgi:hypothetical protein